MASKKKQDDAYPFSGQAITEFNVKITNAGDGLSKALRLDPVHWKFGDRVTLALEGWVVKAVVEPVNPHDPRGDLKLDLVVKAGVGTPVDSATIEEAIELTRERIIQAQEEAAGIQRLPEPTSGDGPADVDGLDEYPADDDGFHDPALAGEPKEVPANA